MIPVDKVKEIIKKHETLEKELSSGVIEKKFFASKSKEYYWNYCEWLFKMASNREFTSSTI